MSVRYRHRDTGKVIVYARPMPIPEADPKWERLGDQAAPAAPVTERPADTDRKPRWEAWARHLELDPAGMTKADLIVACDDAAG